MDTCTFSGRWVFPVNGPPLERGTVTIAGPRILAVDASGRRRPAQDFENAAILPGFVNAHTHLDLCGLRGKIQPGKDFFDWLRAVIQHRRSITQDQLAADIQAGIRECGRYGTTAIGDISGQGMSWLLQARAPMWAVVFYELLGLPAAKASEVEVEVQRWLGECLPSENCRRGLSPHAPYSVRSSLFRFAADLARDRQVPLATHLAETSGELELLRQRRGRFVDFLIDLGVWDADGLISEPGEVLRINQHVPNFLIVHGNYLAASDAIPRRATVVYCPRTHSAFGHGPHPFRDYLAAGTRVALGTDSLASNPDLNILAEARFLHERYYDVSGAALLRMITLSGAEALGWENVTGSLTPGKSADLVVLPLPPGNAEDPYNLVFHSNLSVSQVMWRGQWIHEEKTQGRDQETSHQ
jgi:cytosine/adenosine deaminase-related metal-dependent hydrolase